MEGAQSLVALLALKPVLMPTSYQFFLALIVAAANFLGVLVCLQDGFLFLAVAYFELFR